MDIDPFRLTQLQGTSSGHLPSAVSLAQLTVQPGLGSFVSEREDPGPRDRFLPLILWSNATDSNTMLSVKIFVFPVNFFYSHLDL